MNVFEEVKKIIVSELNCKPEQVTLDVNLKDDLGADSIDAVQIVMDIEDTFGITVDEDNAQSMLTVKNIVEYIEANTK
ncbi:MAG: acyl carrier protein [Acholeplasmatales bacterium]|jgi:acyl carrier protein|nr:acyl carrier protein [Acholeplasmatales bacterium]